MSAKSAKATQPMQPEQSAPAPEVTELASQLETVSKALVQIDAVSAGIAALRSKYANVLFDVKTTKGMKEACDARAEVREPRYEVERLRKAAKRPVLDLGKKLDTEAERITNELLAIEEPLDAQITAEQKRKEDEKKAREDAERARIAALQARVDEIRQYPLDVAGTSAEHIESIIKKVVDLCVDDTFAELKQQAEGAKATTLIRLRAAHGKAVALEAEQTRLAEERAENERIRLENEAHAATQRTQLAEEERLARVAREKEAAELRAAAELNQMRMSEIQGIQQQVIIAQCGRLGVRKGGTIECIRETLAETERWPIEESNFGPLTGMAGTAKDNALTSIRELLAAAEAKAAQAAEIAAAAEANAKRMAEENAALLARQEAQLAEDRRLLTERKESERIETERQALREAEELRLTEARAQLEADQETLRLAQERAAAPLAIEPPPVEAPVEVPEPALEKPFRPTDEAIIHMLSTTYCVSRTIVISWLASMDLRKALAEVSA